MKSTQKEATDSIKSKLNKAGGLVANLQEKIKWEREQRTKVEQELQTLLKSTNQEEDKEGPVIIL